MINIQSLYGSYMEHTSIHRQMIINIFVDWKKKLVWHKKKKQKYKNVIYFYVDNKWVNIYWNITIVKIFIADIDTSWININVNEPTLSFAIRKFYSYTLQCRFTHIYASWQSNSRSTNCRYTKAWDIFWWNDEKRVKCG